VLRSAFALKRYGSVVLRASSLADGDRSGNLKISSLFTDAGLEQQSMAGIPEVLPPFTAECPRFCRPLVKSGDGI
jgi:hypothetical protein